MSFIVGEELPPLQVQITRDRLVRYAGASLDFNPIHWNERFAREVGLPDVIAHGMLTMALAGRLVTGWAGDPAAVRDRRTLPALRPRIAFRDVARATDSRTMIAAVARPIPLAAAVISATLPAKRVISPLVVALGAIVRTGGAESNRRGNWSAG